MKFKLGKQWIDDRNHVVKLIRRLFDDSGQSDRFLHSVDEGEVLLREGEELEDIFLLLEGSVDLFKKKPNTETDYPVSRLEPGSFIGIIAFTTGEPSLTTAIAVEPSVVLKIPDREVRLLFKKTSISVITWMS
jgi:CRP-like cAMP-binding protein